MSQAIMAQKQKTLAEAAQANPEHRFTNLYSLMHWDYWIRMAMDTVLARSGSTTAGIDGKARDYFKDHYEETVKIHLFPLHWIRSGSSSVPPKCE